MEDILATQDLEGRLELTWTNKDKRLLADEDGNYEWVPPADYRVAEVRLLNDSGAVGEVEPPSRRASDNLLIQGDALNALTSLTELPEFGSELAGNVKLVYLDPPFNTQQSFLHYDDALEHSVWLTMMRDRLVQVRKLLRPDGSVWVHCDDTEQAYLKAMMDEIFGRDQFVADVIWEKADSPRMDARLFSERHDHLLVFRKSSAWKPNGMPMDAEAMAHFDQVDEAGERYRRVLLRKWGANSRRQDRPNLFYPLIAPDGTEVLPIRTDGAEGRWRWKRERYEGNKDQIEWVEQPKSGWQPYVRQMAKDARTRPPETIWPYGEVGSNRQGKAEIKNLLPPGTEPFSTPKPEALLERIIHIGSNTGDLVLDCFLGSGTTAAVAHKTKRRWIGIERSTSTLDQYVVPRLTKVVDGDDPGGVSADAGWEGGGGFRLLKVAPSMFEISDGGVLIASWASNGKLAEATSAQLGFEFSADPPFAGRKGRTRLAVIDGLVNTDVARVLVNALPDGEILTLCGTAVDDDVRPALRELRRGSTVRKIPASILADYRSAN